MGSRSRLFAAMSLAVLPVSTGMVAAPSFAAEAVRASGACWAYSVNGTTNESSASQLVEATQKASESGTGGAGLNDGLVTLPGAPLPVAWSPDPDGAELLLDSSGSTAQNGTRGFSLDIADGPTLTDADHLDGAGLEGDVHALLHVIAPGAAVPEPVFASGTFAQGPDGSMPKLTLSSSEGLPLEAAGDYTVVLQSLYFVAANSIEGAPPQMWACNAQTEEAATNSGTAEPGVNPATAPLQFAGVLDTFAVADVSTLKTTDIVGQVATNAVRAGDEVVLEATGLSTDATYEVGFGPAEGPFAISPTTLTTDESGRTASTDVLVPEGVTPGAGVIRLLDADKNAAGVDLPVRLLGDPTLAVEEAVGEESVTLTVRGTDFDPLQQVRLRSRAGDATGKDKAASLYVQEDGSFEATYEVTDADATALRVRQERPDGRATHVVRHDLTNAVPAPPVDPPVDAPLDPPVSPPVDPQVNVPSAPAPTTPPVQIPVPEERKIDEIGVPEVPEETAPVLSVSRTRLEGSPSVGELFGGVSKRQVRFEVENTGDGEAENPAVLLGVGRTADVEPGELVTEIGDLPPGARVAVGVNVSLPMASFGTYQVVGQVGEESGPAFTLRWDAFPYGLIGLNVVGIGLLVWGVSRRRNSAAPLPAGPAGEEMGASVVDLEALDKWWKDGRVVHAPVEVDDNDSVVDLEAADRWWSRNQNKVS